MTGPHQDDSGWERWTIGPGGKDVHNWERLFEIHRTWPDDFKDYLNDLRAVEAPQEIWSLVPIIGAKSNKVINRDYLFEKYGRMFFSSSITYCIALAIEESPSDIGLWGIDLESGEEYISQFVGCKFFLTLARLAGINVHLPTDCGLLRDLNPYPDRYENLLALTYEKKVKWLNHQLGQMEPQFELMKSDFNRGEGNLLAMRRLGAPAEDITKAEQELIGQNVRVGQSAANIAALKGELSATQFYQRMFVWGLFDPDASGI